MVFDKDIDLLACLIYTHFREINDLIGVYVAGF